MNLPKIVQCQNCKSSLGNFSLKTFASYFKGYDERGKRILFCSEDCYEQYKKQFEVELYKTTPIYSVICDGEARYMPYWFSSYFFMNIDDCRKRIDSKNIGIYPVL